MFWDDRLYKHFQNYTEFILSLIFPVIYSEKLSGSYSFGDLYVDRSRRLIRRLPCYVM
jgi:hypothetical protein